MLISGCAIGGSAAMEAADTEYLLWLGGAMGTRTWSSVPTYLHSVPMKKMTTC
jgi:hypothetical protein